MPRITYLVALAAWGVILAIFDSPNLLAAQSATAQSSSGTYSIKAEMVDAASKAKKQEATVVVTTQGVQLVDPATVNETPRIGEGHLHYRVDNGPVVATTATKLSFHELTHGMHTVTVMLVANDHSPLSAPVTFNLTIP